MNIGLVGVTAGEVPGCDVTDPWDALQRGAAELSDADIVVGIVPARLSRANQGPELGLDLLVTGGEPVKLDQPRPWRDGFQVGSGGRTKTLGIVGLTLRPDATRWAPDPTRTIQAEYDRTAALRQRVAARRDRASDEAQKARYDDMLARYDAAQAEREATLSEASSSSGVAENLLDNRLVDLSREVEDQPATAALVARAKAAITQLGTGDGDMTTMASVPRLVPGQGDWAGSDRCQGCHAEEHAQWSGTGHARAYASLVLSLIHI